ncbi:Transcription factor PRE5-like protein, partial [Drosera capensis]
TPKGRMPGPRYFHRAYRYKNPMIVGGIKVGSRQLDGDERHSDVNLDDECVGSSVSIHQPSRGESILHPFDPAARPITAIHFRQSVMSRRKHSTGSSRMTEDKLINLILKLEVALSGSNQRHTTRASASKKLKQVCNHIQDLQNQVDHLSAVVAHQLSSIEMITDQDINAVISTLIHR